jgi:hypothetical protein
MADGKTLRFRNAQVATNLSSKKIVDFDVTRNG